MFGKCFRELVFRDPDGLADILQRVFCDYFVFVLANNNPNRRLILTCFERLVDS